MHSFSLNHLHYKKFDSYVPIFLVYCGKLFAYTINHVLLVTGEICQNTFDKYPPIPHIIEKFVDKNIIHRRFIGREFHDHDTETCAYMLNRPKIWTEQRHQFPIKFQSLQIAKFLN